MENLSAKIPIHDFLPHREPMLMVDHIEEIDAEHVWCSFVVTADNIFLNEGELQETGLIEHMAQTCSSIVGQTYYSKDYNPHADKRIIGFISAIKTLQVFLLPKIGDCIRTKAVLSSRFDGDDYSICTMLVESNDDHNTFAKAEINLFLQENK